jgi:hypothetical protein
MSRCYRLAVIRQSCFLSVNSWFPCCFLLVLALCAANSLSAQQDDPRLRIANFMENPPAEKLDFYLDAEDGPVATALSFAEASGAIPIASGEHSIVAVAAGAPKSAGIFTESFTVSPDSSYVVIAVRTPEDTLRAVVVTRVLSPLIPSAKLMAGLIHVAPRLDTVRWRCRNAGGNIQADGMFWFSRRFNGLWYFLPVDEGPIRSTISRQDITSGNQFVDQYLGGDRVVHFNRQCQR